MSNRLSTGMAEPPEAGPRPTTGKLEENQNHPGADSEAEDAGVMHQARESKRQIGIISAIFLIFNRMVGAGILVAPEVVFALSGSVGLALVLWIAGTLIALAGAAVYLEWGTAIPKNGGEKNYLEYVYRKPRFLATGFYAGYVLLGWAGGNSVVFGGFMLRAFGATVNGWNQRGLGLLCITSAFLIHGLALKWGLRLQNLLGIVKLVTLVVMVICCFLALSDQAQLPYKERPRNFDNAFAGTTGSISRIVTALFSVLWCYSGYNNANYALGETRNPTHTLKIAAPTAIVTASVLYMLLNVTFLVAVDKLALGMGSRSLVEAELFGDMMGSIAVRVFLVFVTLLEFSNVLSVIFSQGRLVQELGREGVLPWSRFWASNRPFNAPLAGLGWHWLICVITMLAVPHRDAYSFMLNVISYAVAIIDIFVSGGLAYLYIKRREWNWHPGFRATLPVVIFFLLSNIFLVIAPLVPPEGGFSLYSELPYWIHWVVGLLVILAGGMYWLVRAVILPKIGHYKLVREVVVDEIDGWESNVFTCRPLVEKVSRREEGHSEREELN